MTCIQERRDSYANWYSANPVPLDGQICLDYTFVAGVKRWCMKIGDGVRAWRSLPYFAGPCTGVIVDPPPPPPPGSGSGSSGSRGSGSSGSWGSVTMSGSGSGGIYTMKCGLGLNWEGGQGLFEFMVDLKDHTGLVGLWFDSLDYPDRFSMAQTNAAGETGVEGGYVTSGWRGSLNQAGMISSLSDSNPYLKFPKQFGVPSGQVMINATQLGGARQLPGVGYFLVFERAVATEGTRWMKVVVEAPHNGDVWKCGVICDVPSTMNLGFQYKRAGQPCTGPLWWLDSKNGIQGQFQSASFGSSPRFFAQRPDGLTFGDVGSYPSGCLPDIGAPWGQDGKTYEYSLGTHDYQASFGFAASYPPQDITLSQGPFRYNQLLSCYHPSTGFYLHNELVMCLTDTEIANANSSGAALGVSGTTDLCTSAGLGNGPGGAGSGGTNDPGDTGGGYKTVKLGEGSCGNAPPLGTAGGGG